MKLFFVDLETTGVDRSKHGVHQISGSIVIDGTIVDEFDFKVRPKPSALIDVKALETCNVTFEQINAYPEMLEVYKKLFDILIKHVDIDDPDDRYFIVGYNCQKFDSGHLASWFQNCNALHVFKKVFWLGSTIDAMILAANHIGNNRKELENFKLATVAKYLGIDVDTSKLHDAEYDIWLTIEVYRRVGGNF